MSNIITTFITMVSLVMASVAGVAVVEEMNKESDHLTKMRDHMEVRLTMVLACMQDENCDAHGDELEEMSQRLAERLAHMDTCMADDSCTKPSFDAEKEEHAQLTKEERMTRHSGWIADELELVQACKVNADCDVDEETLDNIEERLLKKQACIDSGEDCKDKRGKHGKHHRGSRASMMR